MKRIISVILIICILFCSCSRQEINENEKLSVSEDNSHVQLISYKMNKTLYGKENVNSNLLTKLDPLPLITDFTYTTDRKNLKTN